MNKKEVIEKIKNLNARETFMSEIIWVKRDDVLDIINQLDEPEKPVVPQFVADWYEAHTGADFEYSLYRLFIDFHEGNLDDNDLQAWFTDNSNKPIQTIVNMHQFDYEIKKEKLYTARVKGLEVECDKVYINQDKKTGELFIDDLDEIDGVCKVYFTKEEFEKLGLWDNVLIEVEEG